MRVRCMIVDDEPGAVNLLEVLIQLAAGWQLVSKCYNAPEAIAFLKQQEVDLIFLDISMPLMNGMELAALLPKKSGIVFTTAHSEYAVESYSYNTIDYLLKPIVLSRFLASVQKVENYFENDGAGVEYFFVKSGAEHRKIMLQDILLFEGRKEYVNVVTRSFDILTYRRLKDIEAQLPSSFARVHQSYIVNLNQLVKIQDNHLHIAEKRIPIGDKFRDGLMELVRKRTF